MISYPSLLVHSMQIFKHGGKKKIKKKIQYKDLVFKHTGFFFFFKKSNNNNKKAAAAEQERQPWIFSAPRNLALTPLRCWTQRKRQKRTAGCCSPPRRRPAPAHCAFRGCSRRPRKAKGWRRRGRGSQGRLKRPRNDPAATRRGAPLSTRRRGPGRPRPPAGRLHAP